MIDTIKIAHFIVLREQGKTYQEIGDIYGVSKQCVEQSIKSFEIRCNSRVRKNNYDIEKIMYRGVYDFFKNDNTMTASKLTRMIYGYSSSDISSRIMKLFKGESARTTIEEITKLIEVTGKSFEELFELRKECE